MLKPPNETVRIIWIQEDTSCWNKCSSRSSRLLVRELRSRSYAVWLTSCLAWKLSGVWNCTSNRSAVCMSAEIAGSASRARLIASIVSVWRSGLRGKPPLLRYDPGGSAGQSAPAAGCRPVGQRSCDLPTSAGTARPRSSSPGRSTLAAVLTHVPAQAAPPRPPQRAHASPCIPACARQDRVAPGRLLAGSVPAGRKG